MASINNSVRVRELLDSLKKLLPPAKEIKMPELPDSKYPFSYISQIAVPEKYMILGTVTEQLLRLSFDLYPLSD